jgi:polygalacturonase/PKD repeat protein
LAPLLWVAPARGGTPPLPVIPATNFVVTAFGAIGDGLTNNATAIQNTINAAATAGGGTVEIPANGTLSTYLSGPINLASSINLQIDAGVMLQMLPRNATTNGPIVIPKWPSASTPFISGATLHDVEISGSGTLDGQGTNWWFPKASTRPNFIQFTHSTNVLIQSVTLQNPPTFHIMVHNSNVGLTIQNIIINTPGDSPNTDGIDLASTNVLIQGCSISDGDDNIQLGSSAAAAVDIMISNCTFGAGHGLSLGSGTELGVQNMVVSNCSFNGTRYGIHMKSDRGIGGLVQNLQYLDITMTNVAYPIAMYSYYNEIGAPSSINVSPFMASTDTIQAVTSTTPIWNNITISNLTTSVTTGKKVVGIIWGLPEMLFSNITLCNVNLSAATNTFAIYNAQGVQIIDSQLSSTSGTNALTLYNAQITVTNSVSSTNLVTLGGLATSQGSNVLAFFNAQAAVTDTNMLGTTSITLGASTLSFTQNSVSVTNDLDIISTSTVAVTGGTNLFTSALSGSGPLTLDLIGGSSLALDGDSAGFNGAVTISNGTLLVDNATGSGTGSGAVTVAGTATLGGSGVIAGPVAVDGTFAPGNNGPGTLTINNNLVLNDLSTTSFALSTNSSLAVVSGNLALSGTLNITDAGGFTPGAYTLFRYGGTLITNGSLSILTIGSVPDPNLSYVVDISSGGYVKLIAATSPVARFIASPTAGTIPLAVRFTDFSTGGITNRFWNFGDGTTTNTSATSVLHTYDVAGIDTVQLVVSGPGGAGTNTLVAYIMANAPACTNLLSATSANFDLTGGTGAVTVTTSDILCSWAAVSNVSWIQIAGGSVNATGSTVVAYTVLPNTASSSARIGSMTIAGQTFTVTQTGDTVPPTVVLTSPSAGIVGGTITLSATATDNFAVAGVEFYRDNSVVLGTVTTAPYQIPRDTTTMGDGSHCFFARAYDLAGNVGGSSTICVMVDNDPPTVPAGLTATAIATNQIYLSWTPSTDAGTGVAGYDVMRGGALFAFTTATNYTDSGLSTATRYCYTVQAFDDVGHYSAGAEICAETLGPASSEEGTYNGLVVQPQAPSHASSGSIQVSVTRSLTFAARLTIGGVRTSFRGLFDSSGNATNTIILPGKKSLQVALHTLADGTDQITGTVSDGMFTSELVADRATFNSQNPCPFAGRYTVVLEPPLGNDPTIPQGFGYGTLTVAATGLGRLQGVLGDGTRIKTTVPLSERGTLPFYVPLYRNQGASVGWLTFATNGTIQATVDWFRPAIPTSTFYPNGFATNVTLSGEQFVPPADGGPDAAGTQQVTLTGGNLVGSLVETAVVNSAGGVSVSSPNTVDLQMKLDPSTGRFSGTFTHPVLNKTVNFNGSSLQLDGSGGGLFLGSNETGSVILELVQ